MDYWPFSLFPAPEVRWHLQSRVITGGVPLLGPGNVMNTTGGGFWTCEMSGVWLRTVDQLQAARALDAILDGGSTSIIVATCERTPWEGNFGSAPVPFSDGSSFSDGTLFGSTGITALVVADAPLRSTTIRLEVQYGMTNLLRGGEAISITHPTRGPRRYTISRIDGDEMTIRPPLREAVTAGDEVNFRGDCVMRLANPDECFGSVRMSRFGSMAPVFVEAF